MIMKSSVMMLAVLLAVTITTVVGIDDQVSYDINTQARCKEETRDAIRDCIWAAGLNPFADQLAENGGRVIAYKIRWFNGAWSGWYVPGYNDIDSRFNIRAVKCTKLPYKANTLRRMWSYFYDHTHKIIICKQ